MIEPLPLQQVDRTYVRQGNRKLSYFAGCDYYRLASHPRVVTALHRHLDQYGLNVAASRLTTGNHRLYGELEQAVKDFFGAEDAICVSSGYLSNIVVGQALAGGFSHALIDERAHTSLVDAAQFLDCPVLKFKHRDIADCAKAIQRCGAGARPVLLTDGMFSHNGSAAPLKEYLKLLPRDGLIVVDDAHGAGVLGASGGGGVDHAGVERRRIVQTATLSKAFGVYGGVILGTPELRDKIMTRSRAFVGNTPLPLPLAGAAVTAVGILKRGQKMRQRLAKNAAWVKTSVRKAGLPLEDHPGPIVPIIPETPEAVEALMLRLRAHDVFPSFIRYPGGPASGYFRFVISSEHTREQLGDFVTAVTEWLTDESLN